MLKRGDGCGYICDQPAHPAHAIIVGLVGRATASDVLRCGIDSCLRSPQLVAVDLGSKPSG